MLFYCYCPLVWHFCGNECSKASERIQFRALKFVYNDFKSSYTELLEVSGMSSLYQQRIRLLATEMYKLYYKQGPTYLYSFIRRKGYTVARNGKAEEQPRCKTSRYGLNSLRYQGAKLWNSLGDNFKNAVTLTVRICIRVYEGNECHCSYFFLCILKMSQGYLHEAIETHFISLHLISFALFILISLSGNSAGQLMFP